MLEADETKSTLSLCLVFDNKGLYFLLYATAIEKKADGKFPIKQDNADVRIRR